MNNWTYHSVIPENNKASFGEYDNIDFQLTFEGRAMNLNSVRIIGDLSVKTGNPSLPLSDISNVAKDIKLDRLVGAHAFVESITTSFFNGGNVIENLTEYSRWVKMKNSGRKGVNQMNNGSNVCELLAPVDEMTNLILKGTTPPDNGTANLDPINPDFSIKPEICLNNASGSPVLPYSKTGAIRLTVNLGRVFSALYGVDVDNTTSYSISNLKVSFTSVPEDPSMNDPVVMRTIVNLKQSIESSFANIGVKVPAICDRMSASFQVQNNENTAKHNNTELAKVPNLTELSFLFNDSTNSLISYLLRDYESIIARYIESFYDTGKNAMSTYNLADNDAFGCGLDFDNFLDLRNQKFNLQLQSGISTQAQNMIIYMYFHSVIKV